MHGHHIIQLLAKEEYQVPGSRVPATLYPYSWVQCSWYKIPSTLVFDTRVLVGTWYPVPWYLIPGYWVCGMEYTRYAHHAHGWGILHTQITPQSEH
jgi:hypothetical protein